MLDKFVMSDQQLRAMALNAMLLAADAQAAALQTMDREHTLGVENSYSVKYLIGLAKDFVDSTNEIVKLAESKEFVETRDKIRALATGASKIKDEVDKFRQATEPKAKNRYEQLLMQLGHQANCDANCDAGTASTPVDVGHDCKKLTAQAGFACLRAEVDEYAAFAMQLHALCNLGLEYALNAASKQAKAHSNI